MSLRRLFVCRWLQASWSKESSCQDHVSRATVLVIVPATSHRVLQSARFGEPRTSQSLENLMCKVTRVTQVLSTTDFHDPGSNVQFLVIFHFLEWLSRATSVPKETAARLPGKANTTAGTTGITQDPCRNNLSEGFEHIFKFLLIHGQRQVRNVQVGRILFLLLKQNRKSAVTFRQRETPC